MSILSKLHAAIFYRFREAVTLPQGLPRSLYRNSHLSPSLRHSTSLLSDSICCSSSQPLKRVSMAASTSKAVLGEVYVDELISCCSSVTDFTKPTGVYFKDRGRKGYPRASLTLTLRSSPLGIVCSAFDSTWRNKNPNLLHGSWMKNSSASSFASLSAGAARDVSYDGSTLDEQLADPSISSEHSLKFYSGSCYLPHPDKEATGGEDAHFICPDEQAIGVADGVGGWADVGVNAGLFARELMINALRAIEEEPKGFIDPSRVLEKAHSITKARGSSTACIIALSDKGLHAINLGDSGFVVIRDGCTIFKSPFQQHSFNFTYQLESGNGGDLPSSGDVFTISVAPGDIVIAGTDGLFDNLYNNEVTAVVVHAVRAGLEPQVTAQKIAALARQRAMDRNRQTPFSSAAQEAGYRYHGGKLDDITVVVSYIRSSVGA